MYPKADIRVNKNPEKFILVIPVYLWALLGHHNVQIQARWSIYTWFKESFSTQERYIELVQEDSSKGARSSCYSAKNPILYVSIGWFLN